jgi:isocitrate dehydrogenase (NAD+)
VALYGGRHAVTMLPGGGIGPELMGYVREVFKYAGAPVDFEVVEIGDENVDLDYALTSIKRNGVAIKGLHCYVKKNKSLNFVFRQY